MMIFNSPTTVDNVKTTQKNRKKRRQTAITVTEHIEKYI